MNGAPKPPHPRPTWANLLFRLVRHKMLLLMLGGAIGTLARYEMGRWIATQEWARASGFPFGTFVINVSGSFILAAAAVLIFERLPPQYGDLYLLIGTGFCGGYTTFSTFEWETYQLVRDGSWRLACANVFGSVIAGFLGVIAAVMLMRLLVPQK
jgi:fluoride exporter